MCRLPDSFRRAFGRRGPRGLTLVELLVSISIMTLMATAIGALARTVQMGSQYSDAHATAVQHARVSMERIASAVERAPASEQFPGFAVFAEAVGSWQFPDTLVVWRPSGAPAQPDGLPQFSEIVVFCPNPSAPQQLVEITAPYDTRSVPALTSTATWASELAALKADSRRVQVLLTDRQRVGWLSAGSGRGALRFTDELRPSSTDWAAYRAGTKAWESLAWVQDVFGAQTGLAQHWLRFELQLTATDNGSGSTDTTVPFLGSAAVYYELHR